MSARRFRAAIVGCGRIAGIKDQPSASGSVDTHAQAYHRQADFDLVAVCDSNAERLAHFQKRWNVPYGYADLRTLAVEMQPRVVSLCSPTPEHYPQVIALLQMAAAPQVIFVEKPICETPQQLNRLRRLAQRVGVAVVVNHTRRFDPAHQRAEALIRSGELGALLHGRCDYYGGWLHNGPHTVDTLRMLLGSEPLIAGAEKGAPGKPNDPCWNVRLLFDGAPVEVAGFDEKYYQLWEIDLRFEHGRALLRDFGAQIFIEHKQVNDLGERVLAQLPESPWAGLQSPLYHAVSAIARHLHGENDLMQTGATLDEAAKTMSILWEVYDWENRIKKTKMKIAKKARLQEMEEQLA